MKGRDIKQKTGVIFTCDRKGINRGKGEGKQGRKRDERKDGVSKSHSNGENIK